jgi:spore maturation protein CgeB
MLDLAEKLALKQVTFNQKMISEQEIAEKIGNSDLVLGIFGESIKAKSVIPNKVYQALACKRAVITQDSPAIREFFNEDHLCLVNRDPDELAQAIEQLIKKKEIRLSLAKSGHDEFQLLFDKSINELKEFVAQIDKEESKSAR